MLEHEGKLYALEVKSGRKRTYRNLEKFIQKHPGGIQMPIDWNRGKQILEAESVDDEIFN